MFLYVTRDGDLEDALLKEIHSNPEEIALEKKIQREKDLQNDEEISAYFESMAGQYKPNPEGLLKFTKEFLAQFENFPMQEIDYWSEPEPSYLPMHEKEFKSTNCVKISFHGGSYSGQITYSPDETIFIDIEKGHWEFESVGDEAEKVFKNDEYYNLTVKYGPAKDLIYGTMKSLDTPKTLKKYEIQEEINVLRKKQATAAENKDIAEYIKLDQEIAKLDAASKKAEFSDIKPNGKNYSLHNAIVCILYRQPGHGKDAYYRPSVPNSKLLGFSYWEDAKGNWTIYSRVKYEGFNARGEFGEISTDKGEVLATGSEPIFGEETIIKFGFRGSMLSEEKGTGAHELTESFEEIPDDYEDESFTDDV